MIRPLRFRWPLLMLGAVVSASAPVTVSIEEGVQPRTAECQTGTCCPEERSTCVVGTTQVGGYYQKPEGSCKNVS